MAEIVQYIYSTHSVAALFLTPRFLCKQIVCHHSHESFIKSLVQLPADFRHVKPIMRIFNVEGRRRNQASPSVSAAVGSIPMSDKLGVDDGLLEGGGRGVTPNKPDAEPIDPEERPRRERPRNNPPPPVSVRERDQVSLSSSNDALT